MSLAVSGIPNGKKTYSCIRKAESMKVCSKTHNKSVEYHSSEKKSAQKLYLENL